MTKKERYQHYTIDPATGEKQWYFPMEIETQNDDFAGAEYLQNLKATPYEIGMTRLGFREFKAIMIPVSKEQYKSLIKDEMDKQEKMKQDVRCLVPATIGGVKICPRRIPNPNYVEGGSEPKTLANNCEGCIYAAKKHTNTVVTFSDLGSEDDDGDFSSYEPSNPVGYNSGDTYLKLQKQWIEFVKANKPKLAELAELLSSEYLQIEAAKELDKSRQTINSQADVLKQLALEFLNTVSLS